MFEKSESCRGLRICRRGREQPAPHKLLGVIAMDTNLVAAAELDIDEVDTGCVDDGKCTGVRFCTRVPVIVTELHNQTSLSEAALLEEGSSPFLETR